MKIYALLFCRHIERQIQLLYLTSVKILFLVTYDASVKYINKLNEISRHTDTNNAQMHSYTFCKTFIFL